MKHPRKLMLIIGIVGLTSSIYSHRVPYVHPPVPGLPDPVDPATAQKTTPKPQNATGPQYLDTYLPPVMQALAYYVELLQYEPADTTTLEPPFMGFEAEGGTTYSPSLTSSTASTTPSPWKTTITTKKPSTVWWVPPSTTKKPTTTTPTPKPTPYHKPGYYAPTPPWYNRPSNRPTSHPTTWHTARPSTSWQSWQTPKPTHRPSTNRDPPHHTYTTMPSTTPSTTTTERNREEVSPVIDSDKNNFFDWLFQNKAKQLQSNLALEYDFQRLDPLPGGLIQDIIHEKYHQPALLDKDNVNEFLRVYDDHFGRYRPISGKKRIPPTKPYVGFLMLYDLLKREAKALGYSKYEGYSPKFIKELAETSKRSAERQLHILMSRMLANKEIERSDVVTRVKGIIKDLEDPNSVTSKSLIYIPTLQFVP